MGGAGQDVVMHSLNNIQGIKIKQEMKYHRQKKTRLEKSLLSNAITACNNYKNEDFNRQNYECEETSETHAEFYSS